ncbi:hypothetical protein [Vreelandella arcis]|uniref:Alpha-D-ribose 1-methylphosphonate 5-triphosphate diphosphatase n=1 Tax=Vreelandella arcis TaxID=416873 RepID=A0A1H0HDG4_9GAMM|nr:hypothetical protein [Halomonas arcis]SDO17177.1 alpha-D-ribose 1-methylphosphonate 5-triphosphate diphosphatase [Halomonas arcis]
MAVKLNLLKQGGKSDVEKDKALLGTDIAEFPMDAETAKESRNAGIAVLMRALENADATS